MNRFPSTPRRNLEILRRPEGGAGGTGPPVVPPADSAKARRGVVETLHQLIDTLIELDDACPAGIGGSPMLQLPLLITAIEAGKLLSLSRAKVLELAARGQIPSLRVGGSVRIPRDRLIEWIGDQSRDPRDVSAKQLPAWVRVDRSHER